MQRYFHFLLVGAATALLVTSLTAQGATVTGITTIGSDLDGTYPDAEPAGLLQAASIKHLASPAVAHGTVSERSPRSNRDNSQTFTILAADYPTGVDIRGFAVSYEQRVNLAVTFGLELFPVADANAATLPSSADVAATVLVSNPESGPGSLTFALGLDDPDSGTAVFNFDQGVHLDPGSYAFRLLPNWSSSADDLWRWNFNTSGADSYPLGSRYEGQAGAGTQNRQQSGLQDYYFGLVAVPEPSSLLLLVSGGLLAMRRRMQ